MTPDPLTPLVPVHPAALLSLIRKWRGAGSDAAGRDNATLQGCADALADCLTAARESALTAAAAQQITDAGPEPAPAPAAKTEPVTVMGVITTAFGDYYVTGKAAPGAYYVTPAASLINGAFDLPAVTFFDHCDYTHRLTAARVITVRNYERPIMGARRPDPEPVAAG